jgi:putative hydrolase of the HAD superfamily
VSAGVPALAGPIQLILFDAVGTLIEPDPPVEVAYHNAASLGRGGTHLTPEMIRYRFKDFLQEATRVQMAEHQGRTSEEYELNRWSRVVRGVLELDAVRGEIIFTKLWQHFGEPWHWKLFPDVEPTITELRRRGYRVGIASNFDQRLLNVCRGHAGLADIEPIFVSSQVGWSKPAPQFYRQIESATNLAPEKILLVGDDWENDVVAPQELGWQARWLDRSGTRWRGSPIKSLLELLDELT